LLDRRQSKSAAEELFTHAAAHSAKDIVRIGDALCGVATNNQVTLGFEKAARALFGFSELPVAVLELFDAPAQIAPLLAHRLQGGNKQSDDAAGRSEQGCRSDGEGVRVIPHLRIDRLREKAECRRKGHGQDDGRASEHRQQAVGRPPLRLAADGE
jgi:hypothetical protein